MDPHSRAEREIEMIEKDPNLPSSEKAARIREVEQELKQALHDEREDWERNRYGR